MPCRTGEASGMDGTLRQALTTPPGAEPRQVTDDCTIREFVEGRSTLGDLAGTAPDGFARQQQAFCQAVCDSQHWCERTFCGFGQWLVVHAKPRRAGPRASDAVSDSSHNQRHMARPEWRKKGRASRQDLRCAQ